MTYWRLLPFLFLAFGSYSQDYYETWAEVGFDHRFAKGLHYNVNLNTRFDDQGLRSIFPQVGFKYKVAKWFKPSADYRMTAKRNKIGNHKVSHRFMLNGNFSESIKRFTVSARLRYQYELMHYKASDGPNRDVRLRGKAQIKYDINNSIFSPKISAEAFYDPLFGPEGRQIVRARYSAGIDLELNGPHEVSVKYQMDRAVNDFSAPIRHVVKVSYLYNLRTTF
jgi:hypothetical protein